MSKVTILKETLATRCEVCHQTDLFDSTSNSCQRCCGVALPLLATSTAKAEEKSEQVNSYSNVFCFAMLSVTAIYLLWTSPPFNLFTESQFNNIFEGMFKLILLAGLINCGFLCFSTSTEKRVQGWLQLLAFCFIAFAKGLIIKIVQWY